MVVEVTGLLKHIVIILMILKFDTKTIERYGEGKIPENMTIQDWGITYDELEPYYDKFEKMAGISGEPDPLVQNVQIHIQIHHLKRATAMQIVSRSSKKIGYKPFMIPAGTVSQTYTNPDGETLNACQYCAFCGRNYCEYGAKADPVLTVIPTAQKTGKFELRTHSKVKRVLHMEEKQQVFICRYTNRRRI